MLSNLLENDSILNNNLVLLLSKIFENNPSEPVIQQLQSLTAKSSKMHLVPDNLHKMVLSYRDKLLELTFANPKSQICCRRNVLKYLMLLFFYYCRTYFNSKIEYFRSNKDYGQVHNETMLYFLHQQETYPKIEFQILLKKKFTLIFSKMISPC